MGTKDPRIDTYISNTADFAQPILHHLRELVHAACPDVEETIKWRFPHFSYKGMLCGMAAFKAHCAFSFWKGELLSEMMGDNHSREAMGHLGRITTLDDLPKDRVVLKYIKEAIKLNDDGVKSPKRSKPKMEHRDLEIPEYFSAALKNNSEAEKTFNGFSYSHKKEYVQWVMEAKSDATRDKRLATAVEWMAEGKGRNWKYEDC
ncbi:MAG: YdeI/OmpD-associated family protein [Candidatus Kapaibacterium sp.]